MPPGHGGRDGADLPEGDLGRTVRDLVSEDPTDTVKLPDEPAGTLMVFRTFPRVSFALVMDATHAIKIRDRVRNPD